MDTGQRTIVAIIIGLVLTLLLLTGIGWLVTPSPHPPRLADASPPPPARRHRVTTRIYTNKSATRLAKSVLAERPEDRKERDEKKKKKKKKQPVDELKGQVVETARPKTEEAPKDAKYLGRYDMKVEVEQKSRGRKRRSNDLGTVKVDKPSKLQSPTSKSKDPTVLRMAKQAQKKRRSKKKARKKMASGQAARTPGPKAQPNVARAGPGARAEGGDPNPRRKVPAVMRARTGGLLLPSTSAGNIMHNMQALSGSPGSDDYLPDVDKEGDTNLLNTRKFRYWDFFQRVRRRVRGEWNPAGAWRSRDPTGKRYGVRDRLTVVRVRLQPDGALKDVRFAKRSGLGFLDDEARRAFVAAGPYPNPPRGLVNGHGVVEFKFGFMFEISSSRFKFYRMGR
ncbi:MAG: TonB C-terminal domain-containing protein [Myxococcales bacterium]|nr:TonB C-terminal domain-containing protein [Myxococcales bacterium]